MPKRMHLAFDLCSMLHDLEASVDLLAPEPRPHGRFRREYKGTTLREHLFDGQVSRWSWRP